MTLPAETCFLVFVILLLASLVMQWLRARKRQRLVRMLDPALLSATDQDKWLSIGSGPDFMFRDFRKLQILKRNLGRVTDEIRLRWANYRGFSRAEMAVTASMLIFAATAFRICGS
jgi:hypothetical protein